jgi:hypothetical protein
MSRLAFAITVPLLLAAILAVLGGYMIGLGFAGEGCRFERPAVDRLWTAISDVMLAHAVLGGLVAVLVVVLRAILVQRFEALGQAVSLAHWLGRLAAIAFLVSSVWLLIEIGLCSRSGGLYLLAKICAGLTVATTCAAIGVALGAYLQGLARNPKA